jgi:hypothetical protein
MKSAQSICSRYQKLATEDDAHHRAHLREVYEYIMPYRARAGDRNGGPAKGAKRTERVFDATAVAAAPRGAGRLKRAITPDYEQWFKLVPGPLIEDANQRDTIERLLDTTTKIVWQVFNGGQFSRAADEMYIDLFAGMGAMLVLPGDDEEEIVSFTSISAEDIVVDEDGKGNITKWYYEMPVPASEIETAWPDAEIPGQLAKIIAEEPDKDIALLIHCAKVRAKTFDFQVIWKEGQAALVTEELRTSPFITPRFFRIPGEKRGRGPAMLALPHVKTLNKTVEMQLKAAAFAILGAWMTSDDNLYNPRTTALRPGGIVKVSRTGGPNGAALERLPIPEQFDLTGLVLQELRAQVREIMYDDPLPDEQGAVRSPTEIVARLRRLSQDISSAFGRLISELFIPLIQRVIDLLEQAGLLSEFVSINQFVARLQVLSPLAEAQMMEEVEKTLNFHSILVQTVGPEAAKIYMSDDKLVDFLQAKMGIERGLMTPPDERAALRKQNEEMNAAIMAAQAAGMKIPEKAAA